MLSESKSEGARLQVRERVRIPEAVAKENQDGIDRPRFSVLFSQCKTESVGKSDIEFDPDSRINLFM